MCPLQYYQIMRNCKDKKQHRYQMVQQALKGGNKPTARLYNTCSNVIRKWVKRFIEEGYPGLEDRSRRPHNSPRETPQEIKDKVIKLKKIYKRVGAEQIKVLEPINVSPKTMRKIWREAKIRSRKRRKKYITKNNLREIKKQYALFERVCEDTKDLIDIPEYWTPMTRLRLPKVQYTYREISCGIQFLGFADERSLTHSTIFANYINYWLSKFNVLPPHSIRQTDNGSEYCGSWQSKSPSGYTLAVESLPGQTHQTIFPGAHRMQSDVETVHNLIEMDFYEIESDSFKNRLDFMKKAYSYQLFFNLHRPNTYKENKTPWELARQKRPDLDRRLLMLPPIDLDAMVRLGMPFCDQGGNDLLTVPFVS